MFYYCCLPIYEDQVEAPQTSIEAFNGAFFHYHRAFVLLSFQQLTEASNAIRLCHAYLHALLNLHGYKSSSQLGEYDEDYKTQAGEEAKRREQQKKEKSHLL